jgi:hypothetical protein
MQCFDMSDSLVKNRSIYTFISIYQEASTTCIWLLMHPERSGKQYINKREGKY